MTIQEIVGLFDQLELHLINSLKRNLLRHLRQEQEEGGKDGVPENWEAWQSAKLRDVRRFRRENEKILGEYTPSIEEETEKVLREQYAEGGADSFFGSSDPKLKSLIHEMQNNEARVTQGCLRYMSDVYRKTILRTATAMNAGGMSLHKAVDEATEDFLAQGINCIRYSNGRLVNIATYAEMALRTCNTRAMLMGEAKQRERMGIDTVLVSQYGACSDTCLPWQGRVYIDDVFQTYNGPRTSSFGISRNGRQYMLLSVAIKGGLFHPNCRHTITTWIEGVSTIPKPMDIKEIERVNKLEKAQRALERKVRKAKRQAEGLTDPEAQKAAKAKVREAQAELREFVKKNGDVLRRDPWRERTDLAKPKKTTPEDTKAEVPKVEANTSSKRYKTVADAAQTEKPPVEPAPEPAAPAPKAAAPITGEDVSAEYADQATPGEGAITQDEGYDTGRHTEETKIAEWLHSKFGGDIRLLNESKIDHEKRADLLWRGKLWDLKTASTEKAANTAIKRGLQQIRPNPGGIILDYKDIEISMDLLKQVIDKRMEWLSEGETVDIMIVRNSEVIKVLRYKKMRHPPAK